MPRPELRIRNFAQLGAVDIAFGDLTVLVGPQATGKSLVLQLLKLAVDAPRIAGTLRKRGFAWSSREEFCDVYFGEGMAGAWTGSTTISFVRRSIRVPPRRRSEDPARLFYIPAHRTLSVAEGWPAGFRSYKPDTPFVVRDFSEQLLELLTAPRGTEGDVVFPQQRRLKQPLRELIDDAVFHGGQLKLLSDGPRRQFKLVYPNAEIAYMAWTAGQREFIPLLLGIYHLVPLGRSRQTGAVEWIVIEEPEMGLHVNAIQAVLLLVFELMDRGYRVALSTHSAAIVEVLWALRQLKAANGDARGFNDLFGLEGARWDVGRLARQTLAKDFKVYYLDYLEARRDRVGSRDISALDADAKDSGERTWGQLLGLSDRANAAVAAAQRTTGD